MQTEALYHRRLGLFSTVEVRPRRQQPSPLPPQSLLPGTQCRRWRMRWWLLHRISAKKGNDKLEETLQDISMHAIHSSTLQRTLEPTFIIFGSTKGQGTPHKSRNGLFEFSLNRDKFRRFYRIVGKQKKKQKKKTKTKASSKMLTPIGSQPRASDFTVLHATIWANSFICWKSQPFSHALLIQKIPKSMNQQSTNIYKDPKQIHILSGQQKEITSFFNFSVLEQWQPLLWFLVMTDIQDDWSHGHLIADQRWLQRFSSSKLDFWVFWCMVKSDLTKIIFLLHMAQIPKILTNKVTLTH